MNYTQMAIDALAPLLFAIVSWLAFKLAGLIQAHVSNHAAQTALLRLNDAVFDVVRDVEQTVVAAAKDASEDGKLDAADVAAIKAAALGKLKSYLGPKGIAELVKMLGTPSQTAVDTMLASKIEAAVHDLKAEKNFKFEPLLH